MKLLPFYIYATGLCGTPGTVGWLWYLAIMRVGFIGKHGQVGPLFGRLISGASGDDEFFERFVLKGAPEQSCLLIDPDSGPKISLNGGSVRLVSAHIRRVERNRVIAMKDNETKNCDAFLGFKLKLPERRRIKGKRPVEVYDSGGSFQAKRIFCDHGANKRYHDGMYFTLFGFVLIKDGERAGLICIQDEAGVGTLLLQNNSGKIKAKFLPWV